MKVFEIVALKDPRTAIDLIVNYRLDDIALAIGLELVEVEKDSGTIQLMQANSYRRIGGHMRQANGGRLIH